MPRVLVKHASGCVYENVSGDNWHVLNGMEKRRHTLNIGLIS